MPILSGLELVIVITVLVVLFVLGTRMKRHRSFNLLLLSIIGLLLLALFSAGRLVFKLFTVTFVLSLAVGLLLLVIVFRLIRR